MTTAFRLTHSPMPRRMASMTRRWISGTVMPLPQEQATTLLTPPPPPPGGVHRSGGFTSYGTYRQKALVSCPCSSQRRTVLTQLLGPTTVYFFGVCDSADAAADFSAFVDFGFASTLAAALAALGPVWRVFRLDPIL